MKCIKKNILDLKMHPNSLKLHAKLSLTGTIKESLNVLEQKVITVDTSSQTLLNSNLIHPLTHKQKLINETSATVGSQLVLKKKIWKDKLSSSEINTLTMKLYKTLDLVLTLKEKDLKPWWTKESKEISKKLWLPTKTDSVVSVLNLLKISSLPTPMGKSWFSINNKLHLKKNSSQISFQLSQFSLPDSMDLEVTPLKIKSKNKPLKTLKMRLFPTKEEQTELKLMMEQFRWYYNSTLNIVYNHYGYKNIGKDKLFSSQTRDLIRNYEYVEETYDNLCFQSFRYDKDRNSNPVAPWWSTKPHSRISRGAVDKFCSSLNSAVSNYKNKNNKGFMMKYRTKKSSTDYLHFEDKSFPSMIKKIKSRYWYTTKDKHRKYISFQEIQCNNKGVEIIYDKVRNRYFLHYPVEVDWYPDDDKRNDSQGGFVSKRNQIISLDPGIRKFMVGYDPEGNCIYVGEGGDKIIVEKLKQIDNLNSLIELEDNNEIREKMKIDRYLLWMKVKNMVDELHWKTIKYFTDNYEVILLPNFKVSQMIKSKKIGKFTKRMMCMYSFHRFKEKLKYKCNIKGVRLIIVDESYTSKTCGCCGYLNDTKGKESLECYSCGNKIDRDASGSRNILLKNLILR